MIKKDDIVRSPQGLVGIVQDIVLDPDGIQFAIFRCVGSQRKVACPVSSLSPHKWLNAVTLHQNNKTLLKSHGWIDNFSWVNYFSTLPRSGGCVQSHKKQTITQTNQTRRKTKEGEDIETHDKHGGAKEQSNQNKQVR